MGRRKISIAPINDERNRSVTFLKRKNGLFKKAYELGILCSAEVAVIVFTSAGKLFEFSSADMDSTLLKYSNYSGPAHEKRGPGDFMTKDVEEATKRGLGGKMTSLSDVEDDSAMGGGGSDDDGLVDEESEEDDDQHHPHQKRKPILSSKSSSGTAGGGRRKSNAGSVIPSASASTSTQSQPNIPSPPQPSPSPIPLAHGYHLPPHSQHLPHASHLPHPHQHAYPTYNPYTPLYPGNGQPPPPQWGYPPAPPLNHSNPNQNRPWPYATTNLPPLASQHQHQQQWGMGLPLSLPPPIPSAVAGAGYPNYSLGGGPNGGGATEMSQLQALYQQSQGTTLQHQQSLSNFPLHLRQPQQVQGYNPQQPDFTNHQSSSSSSSSPHQQSLRPILNRSNSSNSSSHNAMDFDQQPQPPQRPSSTQSSSDSPATGGGGSRPSRSNSLIKPRLSVNIPGSSTPSSGGGVKEERVLLGELITAAVGASGFTEEPGSLSEGPVAEEDEESLSTAQPISTGGARFASELLPSPAGFLSDPRYLGGTFSGLNTAIAMGNEDTVNGGSVFEWPKPPSREELHEGQYPDSDGDSGNGEREVRKLKRGSEDLPPSPVTAAARKIQEEMAIDSGLEISEDDSGVAGGFAKKSRPRH